MGKRSIVHVEIPAADPTAAARFYAELCGWEIEHNKEMNYSMWEGGNVGGGFPELGEMFKPGDVLIYIGSEDIPADLARVEALGGKTVMPESEIPGFGSMAFFEDPSGNRVAFWRSSNE